jgi:starvation-inducible DNA-binding protein
MNQNIDILNEYMANLQVEIHNLYNMHFNAIGSDFSQIHKKLQTYYEKLSLFYDEIAERIKMLKGYPITNLVKIEEISQIKSMQSRDYTNKQILEVLQNDFSYLKEYTNDLIHVFSENNDAYTSHILLEIFMFLEKENWMIQANLK